MCDAPACSGLLLDLRVCVVSCMNRKLSSECVVSFSLAGLRVPRDLYGANLTKKLNCQDTP
jgi:hypothetical protein